MSTEGNVSASGQGRHREHLSPGRSHRIYPRLSDEEKALVVEAARRAGLTPAGYTAQVVIGVARAEEPATGLTGDLRELQRQLFAARRAVNMFGSNVNQAAAAANATGELPGWAVEAVQLCAHAVARLDQVTALIDRRLR
ncbi:hypothetical protein [Micromonospora echinofusca]|uniref:hypothetical protein n=1 Tax=Micromonospora echinofusca TaxID=47858 RepID=UPI000B5ACA23|nr:hypothetical protein [Micromonospora echinofusca]